VKKKPSKKKDVSPADCHIEIDESKEVIPVPESLTSTKVTYKISKRSLRSAGIVGRNHSKKEYDQFEVLPELILNDQRTTLMIKNIPNKYSQVTLVETVNQSHKGRYDFLYLPIDFRNQCSIGYAFINLRTKQDVLSFYQAYHEKRWAYYQSKKVCQVTYARIQGKRQLVSHFNKSPVMRQPDKKLHPLIFD